MIDIAVWCRHASMSTIEGLLLYITGENFVAKEYVLLHLNEREGRVCEEKDRKVYIRFFRTLETRFYVDTQFFSG